MGGIDARLGAVLATELAVWRTAWWLGMRIAVGADQPRRRYRGLIWLVTCTPLTLLPPVLNLLTRTRLGSGAVASDTIASEILRVLSNRLPYRLLGLALLGLWLGLWTGDGDAPVD